MPRDHENVHVEATPHFDGKKESIINDPTATAGSAMGVDIEGERTDEKNPFNIVPKREKDLDQFEKLMRGKSIQK